MRMVNAGTRVHAPSRSGKIGILGLLRQTFSYLGPYRRESLLMLLGIVLDIAFGLIFSFSVKALIDDAVAHRNQQTISVLLASLSVLFVISTLAGTGRDLLASNVEARLANDLRLRLIAHLHVLSPAFYVQVQTGDLISRFTTDVLGVMQAVVRSFPTMMYRLVQALACLIGLAYLDWRLTLINLATLPLVLVGPKYLVPRAIQANDQQARSNARAVSAAQEQIAGQAVIRVFGLQHAMLATFRQQLAVLAPLSTRASFLSRLTRTVTGTGISLASLAVTAVGVLLVFHRDLSVGGLVGFIGLLNLFGQALFRLFEVLPEWLAGANSMQRLEEIFSERQTVRDQDSATALPRIAHQIRFDNVRFNYEGAERTIDGLTLDIPVGQTVAFVGRSGSGKSTILSLLLRLYDPTSGTITIDGHELRSITQESLRAQFGVVFQESFLFDRSIRENIRLGYPNASDAAVDEAARTAQIHSLIASLPDGYDTVVGERGGRLSGGQRQRIALARAILRNPAVLVLDEATSALDPATEAAFNQTLEGLSAQPLPSNGSDHSEKGRTVISVTHRLQSVTRAYRIFVLDQGRLAEQGTHDELLQHEGVYRHLWEQQSGFVLGHDGRTAEVTPQRLRQIPLFAQADDVTLADLTTRFVAERYAQGELIIVEGDVADKFYIIVHGSVDVFGVGRDKQEHHYAVREDGEFFGEIALLANIPRTASVRALTPCLLLTLGRKEFGELLLQAPAMQTAVAQMAAQRLEEVAALRART